MRADSATVPGIMIGGADFLPLGVLTLRCMSLPAVRFPLPITEIRSVGDLGLRNWMMFVLERGL